MAAAVAVLVMVMVVMMLMVVAAALAMLIVVMMMVMLVLLVLGAHFFQQLIGQGHLLNGGEDGLAGKLIPGSGEDGGVGILLPQHFNGGMELFVAQLLGAGEDQGAGGLHLVVIKLAEVLHIDLHLAGVHHGNGAAQHHGAFAFGHGIFNSHDHIAELAHAGGLNEHPVRLILGHNVLEGLVEIAHQGAADAAGGHLGDLHAGLLQKAAVNADLTEFIFDEHQLFALVNFREKLFDESSLAGA